MVGKDGESVRKGSNALIVGIGCYLVMRQWL